MLKITVEGWKNTLLREFKDAFDPSKTSPKESIQPWVDKILLTVKPSEMNDFSMVSRVRLVPILMQSFILFLKTCFQARINNRKLML